MCSFPFQELYPETAAVSKGKASLLLNLLEHALSLSLTCARAHTHTEKDRQDTGWNIYPSE